MGEGEQAPPEGVISYAKEAIVATLAGSIRYVTAGFEGDVDPHAPGFRAAATTFITLAERLDARLTTSDELDEDLNPDS